MKRTMAALLFGLFLLVACTDGNNPQTYTPYVMNKELRIVCYWNGKNGDGATNTCLQLDSESFDQFVEKHNLKREP